MIWKRLALRLLLIVTGVYVVVLVVMLLSENKIIYPAPVYPQGSWNPDQIGAKDVYFDSADGTKLHGWFRAHPSSRGVLLLCHGNGEHVGYLGGEIKALSERFQLDVFAFDYRGYGRSKGSPHEQGILADGEAALATALKESGRPLNKAIVYGRSLGGGVAVHLAASNEIGGLVLESTFSSMAETASSHYPVLPVGLLMRNRYDSIKIIKRYRGPLLQIHGDDDRIVPFRLGKKLFDASPSDPKEFVVMKGKGHNNIPRGEVWKAMTELMSQVYENEKK